jgi:hypothetical protein
MLRLDDNGHIRNDGCYDLFCDMDGTGLTSTTLKSRLRASLLRATPYLARMLG